jgi:hypothetical protein
VRSLLALAGVAAVATGLWRGIPVLWGIANEALGKCDYLPCVWPWTLPSLAGFGLLLIAGAILTTWALFGRSGLLRRRGN